MRLLIQRVQRATVTAEDTPLAHIEQGICAFLGVARDDSDRDSSYLAHKLLNLRIFSDGSREFHRSVLDTGGEILVVSQFTLCGNVRQGRRPSLSDAAPPDRAQPLYTSFVNALVQAGANVKTGQFQEHMVVTLVNDGPVTFMIESR